jgi:hypothetical protein
MVNEILYFFFFYKKNIISNSFYFLIFKDNSRLMNLNAGSNLRMQISNRSDSNYSQDEKISGFMISSDNIDKL